jgi:hypothetical protein
MAEPQQPQGPPQAPGGGMSYDEFKGAVQSGMEGGDPNRPPQPPEEHPVRRFFSRLLNGEHGEGLPVSRGLDIGRSAVRGVANMANETVKTLGEGEAYAFRKTGLGGDEFNKEYDAAGGARAYTEKKLASSDVPLQIPTDEVFGKRSDDLLSGFTEDAAQFMSSFALGDVAAAGKLGELRGAVGLGTRVLRGAATEFSAFDPHSGSMAGLIAKIPFAPARALGQALMAKPDDSELTVRLKRAASGAIPALFIDGLVEGAQLFKAKKVLAEGASGAEKATAEAQVAKSTKTLDEIQKGTYTPPDAHVVARPNEDGTWQIKPASTEFQQKAIQTLLDARAKLPKLAADAPAVDPEALAETQPHFDTLKDPNATPEAKAEAQAKLDEIGARGSKPYPEFKRGDPIPDEMKARMFPDEPVFKDRAEAEQQAESINNAMNERLQAAKNINGLTTEQATQLRDTFKRMMTAPTEEDLKGLVEGTHFNFSYYNEPDQILSMVESVSKTWKSEIDAAQKVGGVTEARHLEMVQELMGRIPKADHPAFLKDALTNGSPAPRSVLQSAGDLVMREYAAKAAKLSDILEQRPHDEIAWLEADKAASTLVDLQKALAEQNSETGRALRFMQNRDDFAKTVDAQGGLKGSGEMPTSKLREPAGDDVAGMKARPVDRPIDREATQTILRVAKLANGDVNALYGVGKTARVIQEGGLLKGALEVGINGMLSGVPTAATVHIMGAITTNYNIVTKLLGSALVGSRDGMREAVDMFVGNERFAVENMKVARMAAQEGRSVINPVDVHEAIPGPIGDAIRVPSKVLTGSEEFTRVTNYRSEVYAKSLRYWRAKGLEDGDLARQVAQDLDHAFTDDGIARLPGPLARADAATFRQPLQPGTFGSDLNRFMNKRFATKIIAPFVRTSINMARWQFERTPILNMFLERSRNVLLGNEGAEAAGQLWTQTAMSGWMGYYAYTRAAADELTGRGPSNPATRQLWLQDHKPYSIKINGDWVSYNRGDPILQPLSIFSDIYQIAHEVEDTPQYHDKTKDVLFASVAGPRRVPRGQDVHPSDDGLLRGVVRWKVGDAEEVGIR